jgi:hypothetical protein
MPALHCLLLAVALTAAAEESAIVPGEAGEKMTFPVAPGKWKLANSRSDTGRALVEYLRPTESPRHWTENLGGTYTAFDGGGNVTLEWEAKRMEDGVKKVCKDASFKVLSKTDNDLVYEWRVENCPRQPDQTEIARLLLGREGVYRVAYVRKGKPLTAAERKLWIQRLSQARIHSK